VNFCTLSQFTIARTKKQSFFLGFGKNLLMIIQLQELCKNRRTQANPVAEATRFFQRPCVFYSFNFVDVQRNIALNCHGFEMTRTPQDVRGMALAVL